MSSLKDGLTIQPNDESTWLSINIGFGRVHQWVRNGPITETKHIERFSFHNWKGTPTKDIQIETTYS